MSEEKAKGQMSTRETPYVTWMRSQDIPIIEGYGVTNLQEHPLKTWSRTGVPTSFVHMKGMEGITGMYVMEIPPGGSTTVDKHLYEKVVYVMKGEGETEYMGPGEATNTCRLAGGEPLRDTAQHHSPHRQQGQGAHVSRGHQHGAAGLRPLLPRGLHPRHR